MVLKDEVKRQFSEVNSTLQKNAVLIPVQEGREFLYIHVVFTIQTISALSGRQLHLVHREMKK